MLSSLKLRVWNQIRRIFISRCRWLQVVLGKGGILNLIHLLGSVAFLTIIYIILPHSIKLYYTFSAELLFGLLLSMLMFKLIGNLQCKQEIEPKNRAVLITGCDTGFGHHLAKRLDSKGFHVFASCLFPEGEGAVELKKHCSKRLQIVCMDVSSDVSVETAADFVGRNLEFSELWAVVNNAGITDGWHVDITSLQIYRKVMDINAFGQVRVTKAFLPLLKKSRGRIINISSFAGRFSGPFASAYTMSKFASVAFTDSLRQEMKFWGISAISVEPSGFRTSLVDTIGKSFEDLNPNCSAAFIEEYGEDYARKYKTYLQGYINNSSRNIDIVINALDSAVSSKYPDIIYQPFGSVKEKVFLYCFQRIPNGLREIVWNLLLTSRGLLRETPEVNH